MNLIEERQSVRRFSNKEVELHKIETCIEALRLAPSACNSQPWKVVIVNETELVGKVAKETYSATIAFNKFVQTATVIAVLVLEKPKMITQIGGRIKNKEYPLIDIGIAAEHFCLQATELGLGTCMLGWFKEKPLKKLLGIPSSKSIGLLIAMGYPEENYRQREKIRKKTEEIACYNFYR